jgi:cell division protein ZapE
MSLSERYQHVAHAQRFSADPAQIEAVTHLQALQQRLTNPPHRSWLRRLRQQTTNPQPGLYLWGGVGRGKTWLMDLFFDELPFQNKLRLHFHHFMQDIHDDLDHLRGQRDPLREVAAHFAQRARVLCLDEFYVEDITDAMILHGLLRALLAQGICLVFTSNLAPEALYKNGLQRERFLPAIDLLERHTKVIHLTGDTDHRLHKLQQASTYFTPINSASEQAIRKAFTELAPGHAQQDLPLHINHRQINSRYCADDVAWFDFHQLCLGPRASADYIELARRFHTVCISGIPVMGEREEEWAHRFVDLVDELYDHRVKVIMSAETEPHKLYRGRRLQFAFQRTASRLMEMRSTDYLTQAHKP